MTCFRGANVHKMAIGKINHQIIQLDNKLELGTSYKLKLGPKVENYELVMNSW